MKKERKIINKMDDIKEDFQELKWNKEETIGKIEKFQIYTEKKINKG